MSLKRKDLLGLRDMNSEEIELILHSSESMKEFIKRKVKKLPTLRGRSIVNLFYESSTRTRTSFELAGKYLGADTVNVATSTSSVTKGESLIDTGKTIEAMGVNTIVIRHPMAGSADLLARNVSSSVINGGDGIHEHPTQALLDMFTIKQVKGSLEGLKIVIVGDVLHSRVARSNVWGMTKLGAEVTLVGPPTLLPERLFGNLGVKYSYNLTEALKDADVVVALRIQKERQEAGLVPSMREYAQQYGITQDKIKLAKPNALVLHPGPMNRGIEIDNEVADGVASLIQEQVTNGVAVRMAILYLLNGGEDSEYIN
ncbi:aspartate carbamoyltransferase catalytic subunit [Desulfitispora alkaliphila]|uniref:aspartate carbamoyltransferase catalytic subunit n=1 Tax=Desulfitispora alkaliphila TaxID=622674 RepID=UPI003D22280F